MVLTWRDESENSREVETNPSFSSMKLDASVQVLGPKRCFFLASMPFFDVIYESDGVCCASKLGAWCELA